jgi:signal transduction histidine kinase
LILRVARVPNESGAWPGSGGGQGSNEVAVHVIDTGPGIAPEAIERIFQPYYTTKAGGSGLGLAITRRIIEAHGGRIQVHSQIGQGSDFVCVVPGAGAAGAAGAGGAGGGGTGTV